MKSGVFHKLYILLWKNFVILKRQYIVTALEILLPTIFTIAIAYIKAKAIEQRFAWEADKPQGFTEHTEYDLMNRFTNDVICRVGSEWSHNYTYVIGYAPNGPLETKMFEELMKLATANCTDLTDPDPTEEPDPTDEPEHQTTESTSTTPRPPWEGKRKNATVMGFKSEAELEALWSTIEAARMDYQNQTNEYYWHYFEFAVIFDSSLSSKQKISYKIRTSYFYDTKNIMIADVNVGPGYGVSSYVYSNFAIVQMLMDRVLHKQLTGTSPTHEISFQAFPYPAYSSYDLDDFFFTMIPIFIIMGYIFVVPTIVRGVVSEKETGIKELMKMSGLPEWMHWMGWMLNSLTILLFTVTLTTICLFVSFSSNGAVYEFADFSLFWIILVIYVIWATSYCFTISAFFERPTLATTAGVVIWIVSFFGLGLAMEESYGKDFSLGLKLLFCIFPNVGIYEALRIISTFENTGKGAKWSTLNDQLSTLESLTLLYVILMMLASICLNMIICLYVEAVMPKKYGTRKPLYFPFLPSTWGCGKKLKDLSGEKDNDGDKPGFEKDPQGIKAGVDIRNLRKEFGESKVAVDNVSMRIFEGQIFCLLGENGAGKTTTMSILTGLFAPTSGTAYIGGYDINTHMDKIRENLGLCPQHNMLFDKMTVREHFQFFGMLKGLSSKKANEERKELIRVLQIEEKKNAMSSSLSGGQKRRLSLGCALIGSSKVVFLDEPTSGMDPEARRAIWDILLKIRGDRTIVLTTHFMEEADVLGDRIAIMSSGVLQCCGTPSFLKRFYGAGYNLGFTIAEGANRDAILEAVRRHVPNAHFKSSLSNNPKEMFITIPTEASTTSRFPGLFHELSNKERELGIEETGIDYTTMDEVFAKVEELSHGTEVNGNWTNNNPNEEYKHEKSKKSTGVQLIFSQFYGLLLKKILYSLRRKRLILFQLLIPIILTILSIVISRNIDLNPNSTPPLKMSLSDYKNPITFYSAPNSNIGNAYAAVVGSSAKSIDSKFNGNVSNALLEVGVNDLAVFREKHIVAAEINSTVMKAMHSTLAPHSAALAINLMTNTMLRLREPTKGLSIEVTNHPFQNNIRKLLEPVKDKSDFSLVSGLIIGVMIPVGLALLVGSFVIAPTEERLCQGKQLQIMTGVNPLLYWCSAFVCDYFVLLVTICLMTACLPIFEKDKTFTNHNGAGILFLIMATYGMATLSFSYIFSTFVRSVAGGFTILTIVHLLTGVGMGVGSYIADWLIPGSGAGTFINIVGRLFPTFGVTKGTIQYAKVSSDNSKCFSLSDEAMQILCNSAFNADAYGVTQDCCANCKQLGDGVCFEPKPYFQWTYEAYKTDNFGKTTVYYLPGLTQDILWEAVIALVYMGLLVLVEYDVFQLIKERLTKQKQSDFQANVDDSDVKEEAVRIRNLVDSNRTAEDAMAVDNICKAFGSFSAVSKLSFGVHHGECFGLLGVNGAGKTTTFRMITGDETRSSGNAYLNNWSLVNGRKEFLSNLGYCPQFDGIIGVLSGKNMLGLFARLRGIPSNLVDQEAEMWLQRAGLSKSKNVQCQKYSGGMKRRLSAAMALIGDPAVILLDEPTSGVDPVARRQFWKIISSIKNSGQAIILTSHSMEECEALCSRLGIMVNGEMQCIGGVQHLKNKFAQGYSLTVKLKPEILQETAYIDQLSNSIIAQFQPCTLKDHHQTTMKFQIHSKSSKWEELYATMERLKTERFENVIEEYAITETTLEEVFLSFARKQYVDERSAASTIISRFLAFFRC